jgi:hypothetical protein
MPALRLFGRRWLMASDDVPVPAAICTLFHFVSSGPCSLCCSHPLPGPPRPAPARRCESAEPPLPFLACFLQVWCILLVVWFASVHGPRECEGAWRYDVALGGLLAAFVVSAGLEAAMVRHGLRGGPFETRRRRLVPRLIYSDFASHLCQV